jgi:hypothetical protein
VAVTFDAVEMLATIDLTLATCASRELVSTDEIRDLMLDLRQLLVAGHE